MKWSGGVLGYSVCKESTGPARARLDVSISNINLSQYYFACVFPAFSYIWESAKSLYLQIIKSIRGSSLPAPRLWEVNSVGRVDIK